MTERLPMFPLNTVLFPGVTLPLHVFEDRYRALVEALVEREPADRVFGSVAIREGYEVGDHGAQSLFRVGCRVRLDEHTYRPDGSIDVEVVALDRLELHALDGSGDYPVGEVEERPEDEVPVAEAVLDAARATFTAYRAALTEIRPDPYEGTLPRDPTYLSWTLAASVPLPMAERQQLLEADDAGVRLAMVTDMLREELRAMNVISSLPATEVARTRWSPN